MSATSASDPLIWLTELEGVASAFSASRDGIDALLRDRGLRRTTPAQTGEALRLGMVASAQLAGSSSTEAELRDGDPDDIGRAARQLSVGLLGLVSVLEQTPLQAFARMHALAGSGIVPDADLGRPVSSAAAQRLMVLQETLQRSTAPALVVAAVTHAEIATVAPFGRESGLVARAAERLILVGRGVDQASVLVPEAAHASLRAEYESNLAGYRDGGKNGMHAWLLYAAEAFTRAAELSPLAQEK